jgi:hypothetical protein
MFRHSERIRPLTAASECRGTWLQGRPAYRRNGDTFLRERTNLTDTSSRGPHLPRSPVVFKGKKRQGGQVAIGIFYHYSTLSFIGPQTLLFHTEAQAQSCCLGKPSSMSFRGFKSRRLWLEVLYSCGANMRDSLKRTYYSRGTNLVPC